MPSQESTLSLADHPLPLGLDSFKLTRVTGALGRSLAIPRWVDRLPPPLTSSAKLALQAVVARPMTCRTTPSFPLLDGQPNWQRRSVLDHRECSFRDRNLNIRRSHPHGSKCPRMSVESTSVIAKLARRIEHICCTFGILRCQIVQKPAVLDHIPGVERVSAA